MPFSKSVGKGGSTLGRAIIKDRFKSKGARHNDWVPPADAADLHIKDEVLLKSVTASSDLDEFLSTATLAGTDFEAERYNVKLMEPKPRAGVLSHSEQDAMKDLHDKHRELLRIPRRPAWTTAMSHEELDLKERKSFLLWRQQLAELADIETLTVTPYEKNLEVWKQLWRVLERSDIVVQIVDCRNPLLYWCEDLSKYVHELDGSKDNIILLNKADLLPEKQREAWAEYFTKIGQIAVFFSAIAEDDVDLPEEPTDGSSDEWVDDEDADVDSDSDTLTGSSSDQEARASESQSVSSKAESEIRPLVPVSTQSCPPSSFQCSSRIYSMEELLKFFRVIHGDKKTVMDNVTTVGFVGYPNVGKSSTLNCLMQNKKVSVSATPGKTKHFQTMYVDEHLMLCDSPGLVMPSFAMSAAEMTCSGILPIDQMRDPIPPVNLICSRIPRHVLEKFYGISLPLVREYGIDYLIIPPPTAEEFLSAYAGKRGFVTARNLPDFARTARLVLKDYNNGKLLYCFGPPGMSQDEYFQNPESEHMQPPVQTFEEASTEFPMVLPTSRSAKVDRVFFAEVTAGIHKKNGINGVRGPVPAADVGLATKRHGNRGKREKLRRVFRELDVH